ncbi:MAG: hypothetical protein E7058_06320 [Lentisphaerae bacterium]|nr:hypothetical protein [Lentisphaerota bacterium]
MMYPYLSAILPELDPEKVPELTVDEFDLLAQDALGEKLSARLLSGDDPETKVAVYRELQHFKAYLDYRIAVIRAEKLRINATFPEPDEFFGEVDYALAQAVSATPSDREHLLDAILWRKLDDLEICHEMDFEHLCVYRCKLSLLQKYINRSESAGRNNFEAALEKLAAGFNEP